MREYRHNCNKVRERKKESSNKDASEAKHEDRNKRVRLTCFFLQDAGCLQVICRLFTGYLQVDCIVSAEYLPVCLYILTLFNFHLYSAVRKTRN